MSLISEEKIEDVKNAMSAAVARAKNAGYALGNSEGVKTGKQEEYNNFWNNALENGKREYFAYAFGSIFNKNNFKPPSTIIPKSQKACEICEHNHDGACDIYGNLPTEKNIAVAQGMFQGSRINRGISGSDVDWQCVPDMRDAFSSSSVTEVTDINAENCTNMNKLFWWCNSLKKVTFTGFGKVANWFQAFYRCLALEKVYFTPNINEYDERKDYIISSINFEDCSKLTFDSIASIFAALSDNVSNCTVTLSLAAVNRVFESTEGANNGSGTYGWFNISTKKPNWKVVLI